MRSEGDFAEQVHAQGIEGTRSSLILADKSATESDGERARSTSGLPGKARVPAIQSRTLDRLAVGGRQLPGPPLAEPGDHLGYPQRAPAQWWELCFNRFGTACDGER